MKAIKNIDEVCIVITAYDWLRQVYAATGVIPVPSVNDVTLVSKCGSVDLDADAEYHYGRGEDLTEYCIIKTPDDLIEYIKGMESYRDYLVDQPLGSFSKVNGKPHGWLKRISRPERAAEENQVFSFLQLSGMVSDHGTRSEM